MSYNVTFKFYSGGLQKIIISSKKKKLNNKQIIGQLASIPTGASFSYFVSLDLLKTPFMFTAKNINYYK